MKLILTSSLQVRFLALSSENRLDFRKPKHVGEIVCVNGRPEYYTIPFLTNISTKGTT